MGCGVQLVREEHGTPARPLVQLAPSLHRPQPMDVATGLIRQQPAPPRRQTATPPGIVKRARARVSLVLFIAMHLACLLVVVYPPTWPLVLLALGRYVVRMWAITVGYHRYFAHRSFRTSRVFQFVLALIGCTAMENGPIWWASWHRRHHRYVDTPADPHLPLIYAFWYAHLAWIFDPKNDETDLSNVRDLTKFPEFRLLDRFAWVPLVAYALLCDPPPWTLGRGSPPPRGVV